MSVYLVIVLIVLPGPNAPQQELARQMMTASSPRVCQEHADKAAAKLREQNAETVRRLNATVRATCYHQGEVS